MTQSDLSVLQARLNYWFNDPDLLSRALTHSSARNEPDDKDNERLEFLGDRVLALLASESLLQAFPGMREGGLAVRLNELVRRETCAAVAREIGLGDYVILADSELRSGGREKTAILADACEALMGALYLDGNLVACRSFFVASWGERLRNLDRAPLDAKTALQEWSQAQGLPAPSYRMVDRKGPDHAPEFCVEVNVPDHGSSCGTGPNKKSAEHEAARQMLERKGIWDSSER